MSLTFAVADLHGRHDLLTLALQAIAARAETGTVVFLGDYVDRGPESRRVLATLIAGPPEGWRWICLKGNHEEMFLECVGGHEIDWWKKNGGGATLDSYRGHDAELLKHLGWLRALPRLHHDAHRVYVHAGLSETFDLDQQPEAMTQWYRYPHRSNCGYRGRHVVHGHDANPDGPERYSNRTNLDTWAVGSGRLVVGVFDDDLPGGPIDLIEVTAPP